MDSIKITLEILGILVVLFSLTPLVREDYWAFRVFDYPRLQKLFLNLTVIIIYTSLYSDFDLYAWAFVVLLIANAGYLIFLIYPFTFFASKVILGTKKHDPDNQLTIISSNVFQDNRNTQGCLRILGSRDADLVLLLETDNFWYEGTKELEKQFPHQVLIPLENTYGMLLYSKLELSETEVRYLVDKEIPSIKTKVKLRSGKEILLYCVHPTPPVPGENMYSTERDKELLLVAKEVKASKLPVIVVGDLNDVAWSYTTRLFTRISGLLDPRIGRGFYNTFHAKIPMLRFPLDHVFCSTDFKVIN